MHARKEDLYLKKLVRLLIPVILVGCLLAGCNKGGNPLNVITTQAVCGGPVDNSYNAPKEIKSENITSFSCHFFLYGDYDSDGDDSYYFDVEKNDEGKLILTESRHDVNCEVDWELMKGIREIIRKYDLVKKNGTDRHTSGLPTEFQPNSFEAVYDSGEKLYFSTNNDPDGEWEREILKLMRTELHDRGIYVFDPPTGVTDITRCEVLFAEGDTFYRFNELGVPLPGVSKSFEDLATNGYAEDEYATRIELEIWDRSKKGGGLLLFGDPDQKYYDGLSDILADVNMKEFDNYDYDPSGFDYNNAPQYYQLYIEYEYGNRISGFSEDSELVEKLRPTVEKMVEFVKTYTTDENLYFDEEEETTETAATEAETEAATIAGGDEPVALPSDGSNLFLSSVGDWRRENLSDLSIWDGKWYLKGDRGSAYIKIENGVAELSEDVRQLKKFSGRISAEIVKETHSYNNMDVDSESLVLTVDCGDRKVELVSFCHGEALLNKESEAFFFPDEMCEEGVLGEVYPECVLMSADFEQSMRNDKAYFLPDGLVVLSGFDTREQTFEDNAVGIWSANTSDITVQYFDGAEETFEFDPFGEVYRFHLDYTGSDYVGY